MLRRRSLPGRRSAEWKIHTGRITPCRYPHSRAKDFCSPRSSSQFSSLFFTLAIRSQLPLLGFEGGSPLIDWVHQNTTGSGFLRKVTGDATFYSLVLLAKDSRLGALLFFQSIVCAAIALVLLWVTLYCKKSYLTPFTIAYTILSALIYLATMGDYAINSQAEEYCVLMLWGSYLREGRGLGSVLVYLTVVGCYFVSLACSRRAA